MCPVDIPEGKPSAAKYLLQEEWDLLSNREFVSAGGWALFIFQVILNRIVALWGNEYIPSSSF